MTPMQRLEWCERERSWAVDTTMALARLESPTVDKAAVDRCGAEVAAQLRAIGAHVKTVPQPDVGDHVHATIGDGEVRVLLLGHVDTVWPIGQIDTMPVAVDSDRGCLSGPGVYDMKAGIVIGLLALRALCAEGRLPCRVELVFTSDEECGSRTSRGLIEDVARECHAALVLEPALPGGAVKTSRKGCGEFRVAVRGVAAHAGIEPERGASAIDELLAQLHELERLRDPSRGISLNVGTINGGSRSNVVADSARAAIDVRVATTNDAERIAAAFASIEPRLAGTSVDVSGGFSRPPLERTPAVRNLYATAQSVATSLGRTLGEGGTGGGSDGNLTAALGVPTLDGLGAVGDGAHALHEHVDIDQLAWRAALVAGVIQRLAVA